jgi:hypothetical protein
MTPGQAWLNASYEAGRASITKALRMDRSERHAPYATLPFVILEHEDAKWIAGAVGIYPAFTTAPWSTDDISDVILWNPRTDKIRILGEAASQSIAILPAGRSLETETLTIYASGFEFFRAWADRRSITAAMIETARASNHVIIPAEPRDSDIPGVLVIGDLAKITWRDVPAQNLIAGAGVDETKLRNAIFKSARLPRVMSNTLRAAA